MRHMQLKQKLVAMRKLRHLWKWQTAALTRRLQIVISDAAPCQTSLKMAFTFHGQFSFLRWLSENIQMKPPSLTAISSKPCEGYMSWGDEFQAFWYEKACQIKTGQNIYIELCTLHGNHNSYAETWSINACFPQLLVCVQSVYTNSLA